MRYQRNEKKPTSIEQLCFDVLYLILICSSIINRNEYVAGYAFVIIPVTVFIIYMLYYKHMLRINSYHYVVIVLCAFYIISTLFSDTQTHYIESAVMASILSMFLYIGWTGKEYNRFEINRMLQLYAMVAIGYAFSVLYNVNAGNLDESGR